VRPLLAAFVMSARERLRYRGDLAGSAVFLAIIVFIFARLWQAVLGDGADLRGYTVAQLVLYLLVAQVVTMSPGMLHQRIAEDVRSGDLATQLLRPVSYVAWELARGMGASLVRATALVVVGVPVALAFAGLPRLDPRGVAFGMLVLVPAAMVLQALTRILIGLAAFWFEDSNPFHWIWQKVSFVLGGLFLPLDLYPGWLRAVASWLPFEAMLYGPARTVIAFDADLAWTTAWKLGAWLVVFGLVLVATYARASRRLQLNGG